MMPTKRDIRTLEAEIDKMVSAAERVARELELNLTREEIQSIPGLTPRVVQIYHTIKQGKVMLEVSPPLTRGEIIALRSLLRRDKQMLVVRTLEDKSKLAVLPMADATKHGAILPPHVEHNPIYREIWTATKALNRNFIQINVGPPGSGKSWGGLRNAWDIDPKFWVNRVFYNPSTLLEIISDPEPIYPGFAMEWDEVGVAANARRWYSLKNLITSYVIQTFRYLNIYLIETVPSLDLIDKQVKMLVHGIADFVQRTERNPQARARYYFVQYNPRTGDIYYVRPRIRYKHVQMVVTFVEYPPPPEELARAYEQKKEKYMRDFYRQLRDLVKTVEDLALVGGSKKAAVLAQALNEIIENIDEYLGDHGELLLHRAMGKYSLTQSDWKWLQRAVIAELSTRGKVYKKGGVWYYKEGMEDLEEV